MAVSLPLMASSPLHTHTLTGGGGSSTKGRLSPQCRLPSTNGSLPTYSPSLQPPLSEASGLSPHGGLSPHSGLFPHGDLHLLHPSTYRGSGRHRSTWTTTQTDPPQPHPRVLKITPGNASSSRLANPLPVSLGSWRTGRRTGESVLVPCRPWRLPALLSTLARSFSSFPDPAEGSGMQICMRPDSF